MPPWMRTKEIVGRHHGGDQTEAEPAQFGVAEAAEERLLADTSRQRDRQEDELLFERLREDVQQVLNGFRTAVANHKDEHGQSCHHGADTHHVPACERRYAYPGERPAFPPQAPAHQQEQRPFQRDDPDEENDQSASVVSRPPWNAVPTWRKRYWISGKPNITAASNDILGRRPPGSITDPDGMACPSS